jgi:hypothetical protein
MAKTIQEMTRKDFEDVPALKMGENSPRFSSIVLLPTRRMHDSGYRVMNFVLISCTKPGGLALVRIATGCDVLHLDGITGTSGARVGSWAMDCLPTSGLLCLNLFEGTMALSDIWYVSSLDLLRFHKEKKS